ncbi:MAG: MBL fold metallo-hydrolase [Dehalococcoidia bacterium]|nr:MAG: MBL fold metallo-hydrolase [Dehalococcoidia bacterium]
MVEEILPNTYKIEIPLPKNPLKAINSYLIKGRERFLIIDTGMNRQECMHEMFSCLARLSVDLKKTDFFITHLHVDHIGLVGNLATDTSKVYFNDLEASIVSPDRSEGHLRQISAIYKSHGFAGDELEKATTSHPAYLYGLKQHVDFCLLKEGDTIDIGDYSLRCIETPGHSPNHMCLYEANKKVLISGDHILSDITPNIALWPEMENPLKEYLASLEKVYALDVNLVLPGHRNIWNNHRSRITELQEHHQARLKEVLSALEDGEKTAFQIAPWVSWDIDCSSWELFPPSQKWFAVGETIAHLKYLEENRMIQRKTKEQKIVFSLA